jgi:hypothetical protein
MRFSSTVVLALPALAAAEQQIPLLDKVKGFFNKATAAVSSSIPAVPSAPIKAATDKVAAKTAAAVQHTITLETGWSLSPAATRRALACAATRPRRGT